MNRPEWNQRFAKMKHLNQKRRTQNEKPNIVPVRDFDRTRGLYADCISTSDSDVARQ